MMYLENSFLFSSRLKKIRKNFSILVLIALCGLFTACDEKTPYSPSEPDPPPYDSTVWTGTWKGTNKGTVNAVGHQVTFSASGGKWSSPTGTDTFSLYKKIPMWNYRESNKSDYPYGYSFEGPGDIGRTVYQFYLKKDKTAIIYREVIGGPDAVFEK
jgi:hypothetical protein